MKNIDDGDFKLKVVCTENSETKRTNGVNVGFAGRLVTLVHVSGKVTVI